MNDAITVIIKTPPTLSNLSSQWLRAGVHTFECYVPLINLIPVQDVPKLLHVFLLAPHSVVKEPAVLVYADAEQGIDFFAQ